MTTTKTVKDPWPDKPQITLAEEELKAVYSVDVALSYRYRYSKGPDGKLVRRGRFISDEKIEKHAWDMYNRYPRILQQLRMLLDLKRPHILKRMAKKLAIENVPSKAEKPSLAPAA